MNELSENITPDLLVAYLNEELSPEEILLVEQWIASSEENQQEFKLLKKIWEASGDPLPGAENINTDVAWDKLSERIANSDQPKISGTSSTKLLGGKWLLRVAAVLLPLAILGYFYWSFFNRPVIQQLATTDTVIKKALSDGSSIHLNKNTVLDYPDKFKGNKRVVSLKGEAFFNITKDPSAPFIVQMKEATVKVMGTEFNIYAPDNVDSIIVNVISGKVVFYAGKPDQLIDSVLLTPGTKGCYLPGKHQLRKISSPDENDLFWITHKLSFRKTPLKQVFAAVARAYNITVKVHQQETEDLQLTSSFVGLPAGQVMKIIGESFNLDIRQVNNSYEVYGVQE